MKQLALVLSAVITICAACQIASRSEIPIYTTPTELKLYKCMSIDCTVLTTIPANQTLEVMETLITDKNERWLQVSYNATSGYIGKWERNFPYAFEKVRSCAGFNCPVIDTINNNTEIMFVGGEIIDVVYYWPLIVYDDVKVGYVGPKSPGPSKQSQMITEATQTAAEKRASE